MRISVLVHNAVLRDARVIKEATTLRQGGYEVEVHGITPGPKAEQHTIPNTDIPIFLSPRKSSPQKEKQKRKENFTPRKLQILKRTCNLLKINFYSIKNIYYLSRAVRQIPYRIIRHDNFLSKAAKKFLLKVINRSPHAAAIHRKSFLKASSALFDSVAARPKPDVVHIHDQIALLAARPLKARYQAKIVWDAHEIYEDLAASGPARAKLNASIIADNQRLVDGFITINNSIARFYKSKYDNLKAPVVIMNATQVGAVQKYDGRLHDAAYLPRSQKILLFQGGFGYERGLAQLVKCSQHLKPDWSLVMMGWGHLEDELKNIAKSNVRKDAPPATVFLPGVPHQELQQWSAGAALGAIPYENTSLNHLYCTPNKLWEYPSAGVPVLCTDLVEMATIVKTSGIGFMIPREFNSNDISTVVNSISDEQLAVARRNCSTFIAKNNWQTYAPRLLELYDALGAHALQGSQQAGKLS